MSISLTPAAFSEKILAWFDKHGRKQLPWQGKDAYSIWLSEVMLQQTQVKTVIPYYQKFIARYPTVIDLALAPLDDVLSLWAGLGYYARARNCHRCAQVVAEHYQGEFPQDLQRLNELPGIGRSTAGAILALAFKQQASILDGNVKRVLCRYAGIDGYPGKTDVQRQLWTLTDSLTPKKRVADYTQAMMDLGALVCKRSNPDCEICPLQKNCFAYQHQQIESLPTKKPRKSLPERHKHFLILQNKSQHVLLVKRPPQGIWGGLWSLPEYDTVNEVALHCRQQLGLQIGAIAKLSQIQHTFSHFRLTITPIVARIKKSLHTLVMDSDDYCWTTPKQALTMGIAKPVNTILRGLE